MSESQNGIPPENESSPKEDKVSQLFEIYHHLSLTFPEAKKLTVEPRQNHTVPRTVPPEIASIASRIDHVDNTLTVASYGMKGEQDAGTIDTNARGAKIIDILGTIAPTLEQVKQPPDQDGVRPIFKDPEALQKIRLTDLLTNPDVLTLLAKVTETDFQQFIDRAGMSTLPQALTSDDEMARLYVEGDGAFNAFVRRGRALVDPNRSPAVNESPMTSEDQLQESARRYLLNSYLYPEGEVTMNKVLQDIETLYTS